MNPPDNLLPASNPMNAAANHEASAAPETLAKARRVLRDAAQVCRLCAPHWLDEDEIAAGGTDILYAVDVDVLVMYSSPATKAMEAQTLADAGTVNPVVAALIGHHVIHSLQGRPSPEPQPLLLLPTHAAEFRRVGMAIVEEANKTLGDQAFREIEMLRQQAEGWRRELAGLDTAQQADRLLQWLAKDSSVLHHLLVGHGGAEAQVRKLVQIPRGRLLALDRHPAFSGYAQPAQNWLETALERWSAQMDVDPAKLSPFRMNKMQDDIRALAVLEWLNTESVRLGLHQRVVLVTATQRLIDAASRSKDLPPHAGFASFAEAYLRDVRCLIGAKNFFASKGDSDREMQFRVQQWLEMLFPNAVRPRRLDTVQGERLSRSVVQLSLATLDDSLTEAGVDKAVHALINAGNRPNEKSTFPDSAIEEWQAVMQGTYTRQLLSQDAQVRQQLVDWLGAGTDADRALERLRDGLINAVQQAFADLYWVTGVIGVESLPAQDRRLRGIPALRFDTEPRSAALDRYTALARSLFSKARDPSVDMRPLYEELSREDGSAYRAHVLHAFVYACCGRWNITRTICRTALVVTKPMRTTSAVRRGREAGYLLAVAERRLAIDAQGFDFAREALAEALQRCDTDAERADPRFASEELAQEVGLLQLRRFCTDDLNVPVQPDAVLSMMDRAVALATRTAADLSEESSIRSWIVRQAVTNGLLAGLVAAEAGSWRPQIPGHARRLIAVLADQAMAPDLDSTVPARQLYADEISDFVWLVAVAQFEAAGLANAARHRLGEICAAPPTDAPMHVERARHARLCRLVGLETHSL